MATRTANFGVGKRESHDASAFYQRFTPPELSDDDTIYEEDLSFSPGPVHGDAREMKIIPDNSVALVVTSPPYFAGKAYEEDLTAEGVPASYLQYLDLLRDVFAECKRTLEPGGRIAVNVANLGRKPYRSLSADVIAILQNELQMLIRGEVIWRKAEGAGGNCAWGSFRSASNPVLRDVTERVIIASKGRFDRAIPVAKRKAAGLPSESTLSNDEFMQATLDVWEIPPESANRVNHPAPFPVELPLRLIHLYTYENDLVLDPFVGSGTTLVAAQKIGRRSAGYDLDNNYVKIASKRLKDEKKRQQQLAASASPKKKSSGRSAKQAVAPEPDSEGFQARATREGKAAQAIAEDILLKSGFEIVQKNPKLRGAGASVNFVAADQNGNQWHFDVTGAFTTTREGLIRTDTLWKSLGRANAIMSKMPDCRLILLTSHLPRKGSEGEQALRAVGPGMIFDVMEMYSEEARARLVSYAKGEDFPLPGYWTERELSRFS